MSNLFFSKRTQLLLWPDLQAAHVKMTVSGICNSPKLVCNFYSIFIIKQAGGPRLDTHVDLELVQHKIYSF